MRKVFGIVPVLAMACVAAALPILPGASSSHAQRPASAELAWRNGTLTLYLTEQPCQFKAFSNDLEEVGIPPARASVVVQTGRPTLPGCWAPDMGGDVLTRDAGGNDGMVPANWFVRLPKV